MAANLPTTDDSFVQMVILTDDRQKAPLTRAESYEIEKYIFDQICASGGKRPWFKGRYVFSNDDGAVIINTHEDSVSWLKEVVRSYKAKALRITGMKNSPQYTAKVKADVTEVDRKVLDNLFDLLEAHNVGVQTDGWRFVRTYVEPVWCDSFKKNLTYAVILVDDPGMQMLERNDFKLDLGFSTITFKLLGRVKRSMTTGEMCDEYITLQDD